MTSDTHSDHPPSPAATSQSARHALDRHGYGFQFAVAKTLRSVSSKWRFEAAELPVDLHGANLHIDIVLRHPKAVMAIECKRVDPALASWCFARSSFVSMSQTSPHAVCLERIAVPSGASGHHRLLATSEPRDAVPTPHQYHVCLALKGGDRGDGIGAGRSAIDDAITQAVRGANGLVETYVAHPRPSEVMQAESLYVLPVVVTTARLLVLNADLADTDLSTGRLPDGVQVEERPWLWFRTMTSSKLRHSIQRSEPSSEPPVRSLGALADRDYAMSVGVVSAHGIADFLRATSVHVGELA